jgi:glutamyl/glutaminyl-tRNA synthetase
LLSDLWKNARFFFESPESYDEQVFQKIWKPETTGLVNSFALEAVALQVWSKESIHDFIENYIIQKQIKMGQLMTPLRLLLVGSNQGPGVMDILDLLGKDESISRIDRGIKSLGVYESKC